ncbi:hypothetical protein CCUS01_14764 [Colletotrichum cuscutae]|uniref:Uncharacterized protein n=1 Tax=Colletotrichum cuscutae TaxID=1209917 RepID=A0AAI9Y866_9PEZI|nr:hypothetical protein CCUS01_14764 [Colletotrichum cuscutae]
MAVLCQNPQYGRFLSGAHYPYETRHGFIDSECGKGWYQVYTVPLRNVFGTFSSLPTDTAVDKKSVFANNGMSAGQQIKKKPTFLPPASLSLSQTAKWTTWQAHDWLHLPFIAAFAAMIVQVWDLGYVKRCHCWCSLHRRQSLCGLGPSTLTHRMMGRGGPTRQNDRLRSPPRPRCSPAILSTETRRTADLAADAVRQKR